MDDVTRISFTVNSFIRGYHVYQDDWKPELNEERELDLNLSSCGPQFLSLIQRSNVLGCIPLDGSGSASLPVILDHTDHGARKERDFDLFDELP